MTRKRPVAGECQMPTPMASTKWVLTRRFTGTSTWGGRRDAVDVAEFRDASRVPHRRHTARARGHAQELHCAWFLDGSHLTVGVARHDRCSDVIGAVASRLGIGPRASGCVSFICGQRRRKRRSRLERRVPPHAAMLPLCDQQRVALVLAVRLFTAPLHDAALRALRGSADSVEGRPGRW